MEADFSVTDPIIVLTQQQIDALIARKQNLYLWGRLSFRNVFDEIWELGWLVQFQPIKADDGKVTWRDIYPATPGYTFLTKRP
jgi:hypothetical protein